jgi:hypothetical protein
MSAVIVPGRHRPVMPDSSTFCVLALSESVTVNLTFSKESVAG